jgi:hypothetical protein
MRATSNPPAPSCELCGRAVETLTRHHLVPRMRHRHRRTRSVYGREALRTRLLWICRPCHDHIHAVLSEKELADRYTTREALLAHPDIRGFVDWIRNKPADLKPRSRAMKRERR